MLRALVALSTRPVTRGATYIGSVRVVVCMLGSDGGNSRGGVAWGVGCGAGSMEVLGVFGRPWCGVRSATTDAIDWKFRYRLEVFMKVDVMLYCAHIMPTTLMEHVWL